jgi:S1-C subfamily serine protease
MRKAFLLTTIFCWLGVGCASSAVIRDAREDWVVIESDNADRAMVQAEAARGCGFYGRSATLAKSTCLDTLCRRQRFEFSCSSLADHTGTHSSAWLGISVDDISDHLYADPPGSPEVVVSRVFVDGPARRSGLRVGDIIESFNGRPVSNARELVALKNEIRSGDRVAVGIRRSGARFNVVIKAQ